MFRNAIVRRPARSLTEGITSSSQLGKPDYDTALRQHDAYIKAFESCGLSVTVLEAMEEFPDSCFVEDVAVCCPECAVVTNPGAPTRKGEIAGIVDALGKFYAPEKIQRISNPGTLEGGDVMAADGRYYIGLSARTNRAGADQLLACLGRHGHTGSTIPVRGVLHLQTGMSYLAHNRLLVSDEFKDNPVLGKYDRIAVPRSEAYASNCIWLNESVIVPAGYPLVRKAVEALGYRVLIVDTSEFRKIDGGLTCLSLRF